MHVSSFVHNTNSPTGMHEFSTNTYAGTITAITSSKLISIDSPALVLLASILCMHAHCVHAPPPPGLLS